MFVSSNFSMSGSYYLSLYFYMYIYVYAYIDRERETEIKEDEFPIQKSF